MEIQGENVMNAVNNQLRTFEFDIERFDIQDEIIVDSFSYNRIIQIN